MPLVSTQTKKQSAVYMALYIVVSLANESVHVSSACLTTARPCRSTALVAHIVRPHDGSFTLDARLHES